MLCKHAICIMYASHSNFFGPKISQIILLLYLCDKLFIANLDKPWDSIIWGCINYIHVLYFNCKQSYSPLSVFLDGQFNAWCDINVTVCTEPNVTIYNLKKHTYLQFQNPVNQEDKSINRHHLNNRSRDS